MIQKTKREKKICDLKELMRKEIRGEGENPGALEDAVWEALLLLEGEPFETAKHLSYSYSIRGYEMFVSRREKSITRSTVNLSLWNAVELQRAGLPVSGPKKLKTFGASYLYPIFMKIGVIEKVPDEQMELNI